MERPRRRVLGITGVLGLMLSGLVTLIGSAPAGATPLAPFIDLQERGLTLDTDGIGLAASDSGTFSVDVGGVVRFALLYWGGTETPIDSGCAFTQPFDDQQMVFAGTNITGTVIGTECQPATGDGTGPAALHLGYFADVTSLVSAAGTGSKTFTFADGDQAKNLTTLEGASLMVAFTNAADDEFYRVVVFDNADFAFGSDPTPGETRVVSPVTFNHGSNAASRAAELHIVAGGGTSGGTDSITASNNPTLSNSLDGSDGATWDTDLHAVNIPADVGTTTVQPQSNGASPDDFTWVMAALRTSVADVTGPACPVTLEDEGPPNRIEFTVEDDESGLAELVVTRSENADTVVPPFTVGTTDPVVVSSTKIDQTKGMRIELRATDLAGNVTTCNYNQFPEQDETVTFSVRLPSGTQCTLEASLLLRNDDTAILRSELLSDDPECANPTLRIRGEFVGTDDQPFNRTVVVQGSPTAELQAQNVADITKGVYGVTFPSCGCGTTHTIQPK